MRIRFLQWMALSTLNAIFLGISGVMNHARARYRMDQTHDRKCVNRVMFLSFP